jgi:mono/diheme cytochrome c family protein
MSRNEVALSPSAVLALSLLGSIAITIPVVSAPAHRDSTGSAVFKTYCAACHGADARGDGRLAEGLGVRPADLTLLARRNGEKFPKSRVERIVDGRQPVEGHGGPGMPIWGDAFRDISDNYAEASAKERIAAVVAYLESIQVRSKGDGKR